MDARVQTITDLLYAPGTLVVPIYQRPFVWTREDQWEPLWNDILWLLDGLPDNNSKRHFLGAVVLQQMPTPHGEPPRHEVIDGQQRMTTLQLLLAACAAAADQVGESNVAMSLGALVRNPDHLASGDGRFKLWPTDFDRAVFRHVMTSGATGSKELDTGLIGEAYAFFLQSAIEFALAAGPDSETVAPRMVALRDVLMKQLQVVSINLSHDDDAQVIFETLNARGTPLLELDNVKNSLFHRAGLQEADVQAMNEDLWEPQLGQPYWREEVRQGRLTRPRAELFLFHWLTMTLGETVQATKLFPTFRSKVMEYPGDRDAEALVVELCADAATMRDFDENPMESVEGRFFRALAGVDVTTVLPLTLLIFKLGLPPVRRERALATLESYLVRRMLLGLTAKNYNKLFVDMLDPVRARPDDADDELVQQLGSSGAPSAVWPDDATMRAHLNTRPLYGWVARSRIEFVLWELEMVLRGTSKTESIVAKPGKLSIEHVLPQQWTDNWPLTDATDTAAAHRESRVSVLGNLTLVTGPLNSALSNAGWPTKRERLSHSILLLNQSIRSCPEWDEVAIQTRGDVLTEMILKRWPGPDALIPSYDPTILEQPLVTEEYPGNVETSVEQLRVILGGCSKLMLELLSDLVQHPDKRRRYSDIEEILGWTRGRVGQVFGGYANYATRVAHGKRPFRVGQDEADGWWMWLDAPLAATIGDLLSDVGTPSISQVGFPDISPD
jgi:hypothetical protein